MVNTILILDDEDVVRRSFADYFEDQMWQPIQAGSAEEALVLIEEKQPDAAVVDIRLPGMDGNDFLREAIRKEYTMACVICTGSPEYAVPPDLLQHSCISSRLYKKPVSELAELERELLSILKRV